MGFKLTPKRRLMVTIGISFAFFVAEITVAFMTKSLALLADAFHYMNDLIGFIVALVAVIISERSDFPQELSFGWQRARLLGAFFNGVFLLALGLSIFLQSVERFISLQRVDNPKLVLIMGCVGFGLNIISAAFLHEHDHGDGHGHGHGASEVAPHAHEGEHEHEHESSSRAHDLAALQSHHAEHRHLTVRAAGGGRDLNMLGAMVHVLGDALNNVGVIVAALIIWKTGYGGRFYADPGVSMAIALMILVSAVPLVRSSGTILLESAPRGVDLEDVRHDLEKIPGIESVHELHIWRLDQKKAIASAHVVVSDQTTVSGFMDKARTVSECLHAYGVHSATLQPELAFSAQASQASLASPASAPDEAEMLSARAAPATAAAGNGENSDNGDEDNGTTATGTASRGERRPSNAVSVIRRRTAGAGGCQIPCGTLCENLMCCK